MTATVIIPTTGSDTSIKAIESVLNQKYDTIAYVVIDGQKFEDEFYKKVSQNQFYNHPKYDSNLRIVTLPENVGSNGFYGHRVYAAFPHLISSQYVLFLDQDCWFAEDHVESMINTIEENKLDWTYSLRNIVNKSGDFICKDDCESLGKWNPVMQYNHVDTNCYCLKTQLAIQVCQVWHGSWGQDRIFYSAISHHFPNYDCTGKYTVNYRIEGNDGSVKSDFFEQWNSKVNDIYYGNLPWRK